MALYKIYLKIYLPQQLQDHPHVLQMLLLSLTKNNYVINIDQAANAQQRP